MSKKILVPEGMMKAFHDALCRTLEVNEDNALEAALRWLSENPIVPSATQFTEIWFRQLQIRQINLYNREGLRDAAIESAVEWQRVMFKAPEPEVPSEIKDIDAWLMVYLGSHPEIENIRRTFLLTFRRGQESQKSQCRM